MDSSIQRIKDLLEQNDTINIAVGKNPTIDEMGAALALSLSLQQVGKKTVVACPTEPLVELSNLVGINKVTQALSGEGGDLVVSFPYKEGEIEKVSYTIDAGYLNIVVKAGTSGLSFKEDDVKYKRDGQAPKNLFIIGTSRLSDLETLFDPNKLKDTTIVNIDTKKDNQGFGDIVVVSPEASSVSEKIAELLILLALPVDTDIAQNLLSGITQATGNFQKPITTAVAFEMAGILMKKGAIRAQRTQPRADVNEDEEDLFMSFAKQPQQAPSPFPLPQKGFNQPQQPMPRPQRPVQTQFPSQQPTIPQNNSAPFLKPATQSPEDKTQKEEEAPPDWLTPKVYRGSSTIE